MGKHITKYHNIELVRDVELAKALGVSRQAISNMSNKRKRFLLKLGLTYKKSLDAINGGAEFNLNDIETR